MIESSLLGSVKTARLSRGLSVQRRLRVVPGRRNRNESVVASLIRDGQLYVLVEKRKNTGCPTKNINIYNVDF